MCHFGLSQIQCGAFEPEQLSTFKSYELIQEYNSLQSKATFNSKFFALNIFVIQDDFGKKGINPEDVIESVKEANLTFSEANIGFKICDEINFIKRSDLTDMSPDKEYELIQNYNKPNSINIYIFPNLWNKYGLSICGDASYPSTNINERRIWGLPTIHLFCCRIKWYYRRYGSSIF